MRTKFKMFYFRAFCILFVILNIWAGVKAVDYAHELVIITKGPFLELLAGLMLDSLKLHTVCWLVQPDRPCG